ncbi:hypothetical protein RFI_17307, partial [Reticulomyxa filosa]
MLSKLFLCHLDSIDISLKKCSEPSSTKCSSFSFGKISMHTNEHMHEKPDTLTWWQKIFDFFFDFGATVLSIVDIVTDVLVAHQFWVNGHVEFFAVSVSIFFLAQFCYTTLFCLTYGDRLKNRELALAFVCVLPFAQLVPAFMWLDSYDTKMTRVPLEFFKLYASLHKNECPTHKDPLQHWLEEKFKSHAGLLVESVIEAFPQSILQMIAVVMYQQ